MEGGEDIRASFNLPRWGRLANAQAQGLIIHLTCTLMGKSLRALRFSAHFAIQKIIARHANEWK